MVVTAADLETRLKVGMEIHVELATRSKMFTRAPNVAHPDFYEAAPNSLTDPVVLGMPGVLPVVNKQAVEMAMLVGMALGCTIADRTKWDRKSYYYPDLPKNYQISQYDMPICGAGAMEIPLTDDPAGPVKTIRITRAHLEEDAGKLMHEAPGGAPIDYSIVDLNRAGTPLLEIVTEPDFDAPDQLVTFAQMLRQICRHLGVSEGIMQRGHMRFEPNINVEIKHDGQTYKTPIVEIKNLNSFKAVRDAVAYEYERQIDEWLETGKVMSARAKSTRGWDDAKSITTLQREKEDEDEYRYFPDPDLVAVVIDDTWKQTVHDRLPELPLEKIKRYETSLGLKAKEAAALADDHRVARFFDEVVELGADARRTAAIFLNYAAKRANERGCRIDQLPLTAQQIHDIVALIEADKIGSSAADQLVGYCCDAPEQSAQALAETHNLLQVSDTSALEGFIDQVLADPKNQRAVDEIKAGKAKAIGALMGQIMKLSKGQANPKLVQDLIREKLGG